MLLETTRPADVTLSPEPILSAVDNYRGTIYDLDRSLVVGPERFAAGWRGLSRRMGQHGLVPGERVVMAVGNGPLFIAAYAAVLSQGGSPLLVHVDTPPAELKRIAERFHARFAVTDAQPERDLDAAGAAPPRFQWRTGRTSYGVISDPAADWATSTCSSCPAFPCIPRRAPLATTKWPCGPWPAPWPR